MKNILKFIGFIVGAFALGGLFGKKSQQTKELKKKLKKKDEENNAKNKDIIETKARRTKRRAATDDANLDWMLENNKANMNPVIIIPVIMLSTFIFLEISLSVFVNRDASESSIFIP